MVPLALGYCEVGKGMVPKFDEGVLADICELLMPVLEGCYLRMKCFCEECCSIGGWIGDPLAEAIDDGAMNVELLIADGTSFTVDCYSIASQCKLCESHETCLEMRYMKNFL